MWYKNCPKCGGEQKYTNKRSWYNAKKLNSMCMECTKSHLSETLVGKKAPKGRAAPTKKPNLEKYFRKCPDCKNEMGYVSKYNRDRANRNNSVCNSCSNYRYNKTWEHVITEDSIKQMRASKAGFDSWEEYVEKYPDKEMYKREVWKLTRFQPLDNLPNIDKRGRCGVEGAYQLDHIVSINEGWENQIDPEIIAHIDNLQVIPWQDNRQKGA